MPDFNYVAIRQDGENVKGTVEAPNIDTAKLNLTQTGLLLVSIEEASVLNKDLGLIFASKPTPRDLSVFCRMFVSMTRAGVSILEAMTMLEEQTENRSLARAIKESRIAVEKGENLASALSEHPKIFPPLMINMVAAGEASGLLDKALERVATQLEKTAKTQAMVKKALTYPIIVAIVAVAVVVLMLVFVIPTYSDLFADLDTELPAITVAVVNLSNFIIAYWYLIAIVVAGVVGVIKWYSTTYSGKKFFGKVALSIPVIKELKVKSASALMARTLSSLISAGVALPDAVGIVANTMDNIYFKEALEQAKEQITIGLPLSRPLTESGLFPPMVCHMIKIGEESGNTEEMLTRLADYYDEEVEAATAQLMTVMEPMIIILMAAIVGVLIASVMAPMMTLYDALDSM